MKRFLHVAFALLLGITGKAFGQESYYFPVVQGHLEAGGAITTGETSQFLNSGFTVGGGVLIHPGHGPFSIDSSFDYTRLDASRESIAEASALTGSAIGGGAADVFNWHVNGMFEKPISSFTRAYITAGVGLAYERFPQSVYIAETGPVRIENPIIGIADAIGEALRDIFPVFTYDAAAGLDFSQGGRRSFFIEAGYEHIGHGDTPVATAFYPIRVGMRF